MQYLVRWEIDIEADTAEEAARIAHELNTQPDEQTLWSYDVLTADNEYDDYEVVSCYTFDIEGNKRE